MSTGRTSAPRPAPPRPRAPRRSAPRASAAGPEGPASDSGPRHWSRKLRGADASETRDDLRYMPASALRDASGVAERDARVASDAPASTSGATPRLMRVRRDRDNVTLVDDERLVVPYLAEALGGTHDEAREALSNLCDILPPMRDRVGVVGVPTLAALCGDLGALARRLAKLRALFPDPRCDVAAMVCASPHLLHEDVDGVIAPSLRALRDLFPDAGVDGAPGVDRMVQATPQLLDAAFAAAAIRALAVSLGVDEPDAATRIHRDPSLALGVESAAVRSRYSTSFDQTNVVKNRVVRRTGEG